MYSLFLWFMIIAAQNQITEEKEELQMAYNQMLQSTIEGVKSIARTGSVSDGHRGQCDCGYQ